MPPKITSAALHARGPAGPIPHVLLTVDGLYPGQPTGHEWWIAVACFRDRREREGVEPCGELNCTGVDCACLACSCCTMALRILLNEVWAANHGTDNLPYADIDAKRLARQGSIPGKTWCEEHQTIEPAELHAAGPVSMKVPVI